MSQTSNTLLADFKIKNNIKNNLKSMFSFIGFNKHGEEYQQAILRVIIIGLTIFFMHFSYASIRVETSILMYAFAFSSLAILLHTRLNSNPNKKRLLLVMLLDVLGSSLSVYFTNDIGAVFIGVYLWLIIGYGFRFGRQLLIATYIASLTGFVIASLNSPYWQSNMTGFYGLLFTLVSIPMYALALLNRLKEATYKAEAASRAKSEFLSHISHEIRTPLNGIVGACSLLEASNLDKNNATLFNVMKNSSNVLLELVNNVLDLSKIESGKAVEHKEDFYLQNLILTTVNLFETQANHKGIVIDYDIAQDTPLKLHGNLLHTKQVLINLVGNAVKFTEQGSVYVRVTAAKHSQGKVIVRFEVKDTGIGISKESLPHIFESFTQAEESIKYKFGGTGLGTTISKKLVELMDGEIGIESELGQGSTFWFEIPLDVVTNEDTEGQVSSEIISFKKAMQASKRKPCRILVAEDNETNILILSQMLALGQHQFDVVKNGQQALDKLEETTYDLMILDYNMPVMGGLEALRIYQAINVGLPQIPSIILSADATHNTIAEFDELGVAAYLTKPIQIDALNLAIEEVVAKSKQKSYRDAAPVVSFAASKEQVLSEEPSAIIASYTGNTALNLARLAELASISKNAGFVESLILGFIEDTDRNLSDLKVYVQALDFANIHDTAHAIAGSATNIGAEELSQICVELDDITPNEIYKVPTLFAQANHAYQNTKLAFADYLATHAQQASAN
ncbi:signal transduction histidine kinase [Methylophilaceae bacterium 11]|nr:signal transduction histidine kinase [Methylophilaceae bacterium 11]